MLRTGLPVLAATLVAAGAAAAQPDYGGQGYGRQGGYAQPGSGGAAPAASGDYGDDDRAPPPGPGDNASAYAGDERSAPDLGRDLALRPDQRGALQAYQQATAPSAAEERQMQADEQRLAAMSTPQRLDFGAAQMRRDEADYARRADAVRRFYGQLTPQQQRRFDQLTGPEAAANSGSAPGDAYGDPGSGGAPPR